MDEQDGIMAESNMVRCIVRRGEGVDELELVALWADNTPGPKGRLSVEEWFQEAVNRDGLDGVLGIDADDCMDEGLWVYEGNMWSERMSTVDYGEECDEGFAVTRCERLSRAGAVHESLRGLPEELAIPLSALYLGVGVIDSGSAKYWESVNRVCAVDDAIRTILCAIDCD
jgi:hypothetical protein